MPSHAFSDSEGVRIAVEIERRGGDFYRRAAKITKDEAARAFLNELAADEEAHMREFSRLRERIDQMVGFGSESICAIELVHNAGIKSEAGGIAFPRLRAVGKGLCDRVKQ